MNNKKEKIIEIVEKYGFEFLDEDEEWIKIEYVKDDLDYRDENDFASKFEYDKFANEQGEIVCKHFMEAFVELNLQQVIIKDFEFDNYDYPCVFIKP